MFGKKLTGLMNQRTVQALLPKTQKIASLLICSVILSAQSGLTNAADPSTAAYYGFGGTVAAPTGSTTPTSPASTPWWPTTVAQDTPPTPNPAPLNNAPAGAPNIVVVLADDLGYSDLGSFGSEIDTPNLDKLAANGLRFRNYTTHSLCSPTRAALLTGINGHSAGVGFIADSNPGYPGYAGEIQQNAVTLAETLHLNGYATFATGKWHLTQVANRVKDGPYNSWPLQRGFDNFYGILNAETHPQHPDAIYDGNSRVQVNQYPNGFNTSDLWASKAISYIKASKTNNPNKPFFLYFADNAVHAPLNPDPDLLAAVHAKGQYSAGWDAIRQARYHKQLNTGLIPANTVLPPLNPGVSAWSALPSDKQQLFTRYQEAYAAWVATLDRSFGQLYNYLESSGQLNNTIIVFASDNGGSQEGGLNGTTISLETLFLAGNTNVAFDETRENLIGGPQTSPHYPLGWSTVSNTPFRGYKQQTLGGGRRVPLIVSWPGHIADNGNIRTQFTHVTDIAPTLLDIAGIQQPTTYNGIPTKPIEGTSFRYLLDGSNPATATEQHTQQYFELAGNRGYYLNDGVHAWYAVTEHTAGTAFTPSEWELYDLNQDFTETNNLATTNPSQVTTLDNAFTSAAWAHQVYPLFHGSTAISTAQQPIYLANRIQPLTLSSGAWVDQSTILPLISAYWNPYGSTAASAVHTPGNYTIKATVNYQQGNQGIIFAEGGDDLGLVLYIQNGNLILENVAFGQPTSLSPIPLTPGTQNITLSFTAGAPTGLGSGNGLATLSVNGSSVSGQLSAWLVSLPSDFGGPLDGFDVGLDRRAPVSWSLYKQYGTFPYTGTISQVTVTPGVSQP